MKRSVLLILLPFIICNNLLSQDNTFSETREQKSMRMAWWTADRFGMFIHWGVYATHSRKAWAKRYESLTNEEYQKYVDHFNPDLYDPETRRLYIHLLDYPMTWYTLRGFQGKVKYAQFLHDASELQFGELRGNVTHQETRGEEDLVLILPVVKPEVEIPVIELILGDE